MNRLKNLWVALAGGVIVAAIVGTAAVMAQTPSSTPATTAAATATPDTSGAATATPDTSSSATPSAGTNKSNEDATHEASEPAARETAEDNGTAFMGHGGGSNEDPTHEASEPAARESQEAPGTAATPSSATPSASSSGL
jgi:hypothetical protein